MVSHRNESQGIALHRLSSLRWHRYVTGLATLALVAIGITPASAGADQGDSTKFLPRITASQNLPTDPIAVGSVRDDRGNLVDKGQTLVLYAWPSAKILAGLQDGESVKLVPVAKTRTLANGTFKLRIGDTSKLHALKAASGQIDFTIISESAGLQYSYSFARQLVDDGDHPAFAPAGSNTRLQSDSDMHTAVDTKPLELSLAPLESGQSQKKDSSKEPHRIPRKGYAPKTCQSYKMETFDPSWVTVGRAVINTDGVTAKFEYSEGASSSLGIGVSTSGQNGSFSAGGTTSVSSTTTIGFPKQGSHDMKEFRTQFVYAKFFVRCYHDSTGAIYSERYHIRPVSYASGIKVVDYRYYSYLYPGHCVQFPAGSYFIKDQTQASTWTYGANLETPIGMWLSASTGYSTQAKVRYDFSKKRKLCGETDYPGGTPSGLYAESL